MSVYIRCTEPHEKTGRGGNPRSTARESVIENQHGQIASTSKRPEIRIMRR